jgi:hypothetical protein
VFCALMCKCSGQIHTCHCAIRIALKYLTQLCNVDLKYKKIKVYESKYKLDFLKIY